MMTSSNGNTFRVTGPLCRSPMNFPAERPVTRNFDDFCDLRLNKQLSKFFREASDLRRHRAHYDVTVMRHKKGAAIWRKWEWTVQSSQQWLLWWCASWDTCRVSISKNIYWEITYVIACADLNPRLTILFACRCSFFALHWTFSVLVWHWSILILILLQC